MSNDKDDRPNPAILSDADTVEVLNRVPFDDPSFKEKDLQKLLAEHPESLPIAQLDAGFSPAICIGREIQTGAGRLDTIYVSPSGLITIVETKLWKNPQSRREVVAQIIDYTKQIATWDISELEKRVGAYLSKTHGWDGTLFAWLEKQHDDLPEERQFVDSVNDTLQHGRFLLLIVGDGIRTAVQEMVSYLQETPQLQFRLALVEIGCYRLSGREWPVVMVPQIVTKTVEVERAVVRIELTDDAKKHLEVTTSVPGDEVVVTPTEESFYSKLEKSVGTKGSETLRQFVQRLTAEYDSVEKAFPKQLILKYRFLSGSKEYTIWLLLITQKGKVKLGGATKWKAGDPLPKKLIESFWGGVAEVLPSMRPTFPSQGNVKLPSVALTDLLPRLTELEPVIAQYVAAIEEHTTDD